MGATAQRIIQSDDVVADYFKSYEGIVRNFCRHLVGDPEIASELAQETFVRALQSLRDTPRRQDNPLAWLLTIARNLCTDHIRRSRLRVIVPHADMSEIDVRSTRSADPTFDAMEARQRAARIRTQLARALRSLQPLERKVFLDHEEEGVSFDALARRDRTTADALRNVAFRARKQLRMRLSRDLLVTIGFVWFRLRLAASKASQRMYLEGSSVAISQITAAVMALTLGSTPMPVVVEPNSPAGPAPILAVEHPGARQPASFAVSAGASPRSPSTPLGGGPVSATFGQSPPRDGAANSQHTTVGVEVRKPDGSRFYHNETTIDCFGYASYPLPDPSPVRTSC